MTRAVFGGYLGEFGWELCVWNPIVRKLARDFDHVTVIAPPGSRCLYEFADEFVPLSPLPGTSDFMSGKADPLELHTAEHFARHDSAHIISPQGLRGAVQRELERFARVRGDEPQPEKEWRRLRVPSIATFDVALAFRREKLFNGRTYADKAYPRGDACTLAQMLLSLRLRTINVGGPDNFDVPCTVDLRGAPLEQQIAALSSARVAVGPSSAPLHLSQLCETGVVTWYNRPRSESLGRYDCADGSPGWWNPFNAPTRFLDGVNPDPERVVAAVLEALR